MYSQSSPKPLYCTELNVSKWEHLIGWTFTVSLVWRFSLLVYSYKKSKKLIIRRKPHSTIPLGLRRKGKYNQSAKVLIRRQKPNDIKNPLEWIIVLKKPTKLINKNKRWTKSIKNNPEADNDKSQSEWRGEDWEVWVSVCVSVVILTVCL